MSAEKYISVTEAKACAMSLLPDPFLRLAAHAVLDATPAAEVEPVMHGRWEPSSTYYGFCSCSRCGCTIQFDGEDYWPFCPRCGADMRGADNG